MNERKGKSEETDDDIVATGILGSFARALLEDRTCVGG